MALANDIARKTFAVGLITGALSQVRAVTAVAVIVFGLAGVTVVPALAWLYVLVNDKRRATSPTSQ